MQTILAACSIVTLSYSMESPVSHIGSRHLCASFASLDFPSLVVALRQHHAHLLDLATQHRHLVLESKGLLAFQQYVRLRGKMAAYNQRAKEAHVRARLRQCWRSWLQRCEHNEEIALGGRTRKARAHAGSKLKHAVLAAWVQYVIQRRHKRKLKALADTHFRENALPK